VIDQAVLAAAAIEFDEAAHVYRVDGRIVPSVTRVLEAVGISDFSMVPPAVLKHAQDRGTAVHRACWYDDQGDLDEASLDPEIVPYVEAWRAFRHDHEFVAVDIERRFYNADYAFCGTFDRLGWMRRWGKVMTDIKTGVHSMSWPIQLAAYLRGHLSRVDALATRRLIVQLSANGHYLLHWYEANSLGRDWRTFLAALAVCQFKEEHREL
jgi:hypothetical protein